MIIDCHTHIGRNTNITASVSELLQSMDLAGIDKALVFANKIGNAPNEYMLEQIAPHRDRLYGVATVSWSNKNCYYGQGMMADWYKDGKIVAVKFYTGYEHWYPSDTKDTLEALEKVGCPVIYHMGDCHHSQSYRAKLKYAHPLGVDEVAVDFPGINFVIAHMGFPWIRDAAQVCYKNSNVYADMSGFVYGKFGAEDAHKFYKCLEEFHEIAPHEKLLFGTDWPISDQRSYVDVLWGENDIEQLYSKDRIDSKTEIAKKVFKL